MPLINFWAVLIAGILSMVLGFLWYGPLFGKVWMRGNGIDPDNKELMDSMQKSAGPAYIQMFVGALIMAYVFAHALWAYGNSVSMAPWMAGLQCGFWVWLGFILPVKYGDLLWNNKSFTAVAVDLSYYLVLLLINGVLLSYWA